jgi:hypothetical protein
LVPSVGGGGSGVVGDHIRQCAREAREREVPVKRAAAHPGSCASTRRLLRRAATRVCAGPGPRREGPRKEDDGALTSHHGTKRVT